MVIAAISRLYQLYHGTSNLAESFSAFTKHTNLHAATHVGRLVTITRRICTYHNIKVKVLNFNDCPLYDRDVVKIKPRLALARICTRSVEIVYDSMVIRNVHKVVLRSLHLRSSWWSLPIHRRLSLGSFKREQKCRY